MDERLSHDIVRQLREGAADVGVMWDAADHTGLATSPYRTDHLCAVVPRGHPLAHKRSVRFQQTLAHPAIGVAPGGLMEIMLRRQAARFGAAPVHRIQVSSLDAACRAARHRQWLGFGAAG